MFYLTYLHHELRRRLGRTVFTVVTLAIGVTLVVLVTALSSGVDRAQRTVLDPLAKIGSDFVVTRPVDVAVSGTGSTAALVGTIDEDDLNLLVSENQPLFQKDFTALGRPGQAFNREVFLPSTQVTFPDSEVGEIAALSGVDEAAGALTLVAMHQKGVVAPLAALSGGIAPPLSPGDVIRRVLNPPQTDLDTEPYIVAGVDLSRPNIGLITQSQIVTGRYPDKTSTTQAVLGDAYARRNGITVGKTVIVGGKTYSVAGIAKPPLGVTAADVYLPLAEVQRVSGHAARVNTLLVRAARNADGAALTKEITRAFPGAAVSNADDTANAITGSLVDTESLSDGILTVLAAVAVVAAALTALTLTLSSVRRRAREFGTLSALGWSRRLIGRQVVGESFVQGALGGAIGAVVGVLAVLALRSAGVSLHASASTQAGPLRSGVGLGKVLSEKASDTVSLSVPLKPMVLLLAVAIAVASGLVAGVAGAVRAARLRSVDALRDVS